DDDCAADTACTAPRERVIEWVPVDPPGHGGNAVAIPVGSQVRLDLMISGWDPNRDGDPKLGAVQAKLDSSGLSSGPGTPLVPLGYPDSPDDGAFIIFAVCATDDGYHPDSFDPLSRCEDDEECPPDYPFCVDNPNLVYYGSPPYPVSV
ncbi:MAG: hypothetical protein IH628_11890, partial [Proteobacteria bacterium]|nr:hypothetical protein [Pseudomonadota bacterium]